MNQEKILNNGIKNNQNVCDICKIIANTANIEYSEFTCVKPNCDIKKAHYHKVCIKCFDRVNLTSVRNINNQSKTCLSKNSKIKRNN